MPLHSTFNMSNNTLLKIKLLVNTFYRLKLMKMDCGVIIC